MKKETVVVNLFAAPSAGKSTTAGGVFTLLKMHGIDAELPYEFAKDMVWDGMDDGTFVDQVFITGNQHRRLKRLDGKVDVIVCDSPLLLALLYEQEKEKEAFTKFMLSKFNAFKNENFILQRNTRLRYECNGRNQNEQEAKELDEKLIDILVDNAVPCNIVQVDIDTINHITEHILKKYFGKNLKYGISLIM